MDTWVEIDGRVVKGEEARVSVFDRGFLYGDSVYETLRTYGGRPFLLDEHLERLARSAEALFLPVPGGLEGVREAVERVLQAGGTFESQLRIVVTRGAEPGLVDLDPSTAGSGTRVVIRRPLIPLPDRLYEEGVVVALVRVVRIGPPALDPRVKSGNYLNNLLALHEARQLGAFECLMPNQQGHVTEGSTSNIFFVFDGALHTPALSCGLLDGITRSLVLTLARELGLEVVEREILPEEIPEAEECFLTSSLKEVLPVRRVLDPDGRTLWEAAPGPVARALLTEYRARTLREAGRSGEE